MEIKWYGQNTFSITHNKLSVLIDPLEDDLTTDSSFVAILTQGSSKLEKNEIIDWPGEFETKGVLVHSIALPITTDQTLEQRIVAFEIDGIRFANLSNITTMPENLDLAELGNIDILFVPLTLSLKNTVNLIEEVDPRMVIPSCFDENSPTSIIDFLKEFGHTELIAEDKISITAKSQLDSDTIIFKLLSKSL